MGSVGLWGGGVGVGVVVCVAGVGWSGFCCTILLSLEEQLSRLSTTKTYLKRE